VTNRAFHQEAFAMPERHSEVCTVPLVRRIAAMLDIDSGPILAGETLPRGWHFPLMAGETRRVSLRADGFPGFGVPMPDLGLPRLLLLGRTVEYSCDIPLGASIDRLSTLDNLRHKETSTGAAAIVMLRHALHLASDAVAIVETQTYMLTGAARSGASTAHSQPSQTFHPKNGPDFRLSKVVTPDETMLFQYSALGFNSHKIHIDRVYARDVEGLPDLVVNGGLITLLLTEFLRKEMALTPSRITIRHKAPLFCGRPLTLTASRDGSTAKLTALDDAGTIATELEADIQ
jgi:3-methylfumaryl-CoA hydratase